MLLIVLSLMHGSILLDVVDMHQSARNIASDHRRRGSRRDNAGITHGTSHMGHLRGMASDLNPLAKAHHPVLMHAALKSYSRRPCDCRLANGHGYKGFIP